MATHSEVKHLNHLPHDGVYTRLKPSPLGGVGVFAVRKIAKGTYIFPGDDDEIVWVKKEQVGHLDPELKRLYDDFCIVKEGGMLYGAPASFNRLNPAWFLNGSSHPNVGCDREYRFFALRDIDIGEELTADYSAYNEFGETPTTH